MVNATDQLDQLASLTDEDKPPDSGYSHAQPHHHESERQEIVPRGAIVSISAAGADDSTNNELNPSSKSLTARLLQSIAPGAVGPASTRAASGPGGRAINRSSSLPNLERRRPAHAHNAATTQDGTDASPQGGDDAASFISVEKAQRVHTFAGTFPSEKVSTAALVAGGSGGGGGGNNGPNNAATPEDGPARPALLSKKLLEPKKPLGKNPSFRQCMINVLRYSWLNVLFVFVPVSWAMHFSHQSATATFCVSFFAIVPLAAMLGFATEELAVRVGDAFGGLLNATFGNAVELIISILALVKGELGIVRSSMLGSILSNCLLVLGGCFFAGGIRFHEQGYSLRAAQLNINLLGIAVVAIVIPVAFHSFIQAEGTESDELTSSNVLKLSRGISFILLFVYACYLTFQLWTHAYLYAPPKMPRPPTTSTAALLIYNEGPQPPSEGKVFRIPSLPSWGSSSSSSASSSAGSIRGRHARTLAPGEEDNSADEPAVYSTDEAAQHDDDLARVLTAASDTFRRPITEPKKDKQDQAVDLEAQQQAEFSPLDEHAPQLSVWFAFGLLAVITALTGVTAEALVDSIDGLTETGNVSKEFVALILLPVVGNAAEHVTAITVATKNKLNLSLAVAVGSSIQIAFFVIPVLVLLGWAIGQPLDFDFNTFETLVVFLAGCVVNWAIQDGKTNWLEGLTLMSLYLIIALVFWFFDPPSF
ncbi:hypothetical protein JCM10908_005901 [Rhodotorula pacifica]|uniref:uncharacterized protein n=1 Tax=Rhodotorula pacifica TaxID=1495444 RepID=UPI0031783FC4